MWAASTASCGTSRTSTACTNEDAALLHGLHAAGGFTGLYYVSPGGNTGESFPASLPTSAMLTLRLVVRQDGETVGARLCDAPVGCPKDALTVSLNRPCRWMSVTRRTGATSTSARRNFSSRGRRTN